MASDVNVEGQVVKELQAPSIELGVEDFDALPHVEVEVSKRYSKALDINVEN
jgi:hypothetical protein